MRGRIRDLVRRVDHLPRRGASRRRRRRAGDRAEIVTEKAAAARENIAAAGLADQVELREGDARETLLNLSGPVDLLLLDGWPFLAKDVLDIVEPSLRPGALVMVDNVGQFPGDLRALTLRLGSRSHYRAATLPLRGGTVVAVHDPQ
jgi:predicted O-methyltransferase YrrM